MVYRKPKDIHRKHKSAVNFLWTFISQIKSKEENIMKAIIRKRLLFLYMVLIASTSFAQPGGQGRGGPQGPPKVPNSDEIVEIVSELSKKLSLDKEQESTILNLFQKHFAALENKTKSGRPDREEMEAFKKTFEAQVDEILSEEQQELFKQFQKEKMKERPRGGPPKRKVN